MEMAAKARAQKASLLQGQEAVDAALLRHQEAPLAPVPNPFSNPASVTPYEVAKGLVCFTCLLPLRVGVLVTVFVWEVIIAKLAALGSDLSVEKGTHRQMTAFPAWRRWLLQPIVPLNRLFLGCLGFWPMCIGVNDFRKDKNLRANVIIAAPHTSFLDAFLVAWALKTIPGCVGHSGLLGMPGVRSLALAGQSIFVDRSDPQSRHGCKEAIRQRSLPSWNGSPLLIFPEGSITNGRALIQFKAGAFTPGCPVTLVCLRYKWRFYNLSGTGKNHILGIALLRTALQFANFCDIDIMDAYVPSEAEIQEPKVFAANVRAVMAKHLGVPTTEHTYEDAFLNYHSKAHVGSDFEIASLQREYSCSGDDLRALHKVFERFDKAAEGAIGCTEFEKALHAAAQLSGEERRTPESAGHLFAFFDQDGSGKIEYRDFVEAAALLSGGRSTASRTRLAFLLSDVSGEGKVSLALITEAAPSALSDTQELATPSGRGNGYLGFTAFARLLDRRPDVLGGLLELFRGRLGFPRLGQQHAGAQESG